MIELRPPEAIGEMVQERLVRMRLMGGDVGTGGENPPDT